jgi:signal transduction histidine kinase
MSSRGKYLIQFIIFQLLIISGQPVVSQIINEIDSLRQLTATSGQSREKAANLLTLGNLFYGQKEYDSVLLYAEKARMLALNFDDSLCIADVLYLKSKTYDKIDNQVASLNSAREYLNMVKHWSDSMRLGRAYYQFGQMLQDHGRNDSAAFYLKECLALNLAARDTGNTMVLYNAIGNLFMDYSEFDSAATYILYAIHFAEYIGSEGDLALLYNNLGKVFTRLDRFDDARNYLEKALNYFEGTEEKYTTGVILMDLGSNYLSAGDLGMALVYYDRASGYIETYGEERIGVYNLYNNYSEFYKKKGKYNQAIAYLDRAIEGYKRLNYLENVAIAMRNKGDSYTRLGKYDLGRRYLDSSLAICMSSGYKQIQFDVLESLALNYRMSGNYKRAYENEAKRFDLFREIFNIKKESKITNLKLAYEKEKDQAEILALKNANLMRELDLRKMTTERNSYLFTGIGILLIGLLVFLYLRQRVIIARQKIKQLEEEKKLMEAKLLVEGQELERKRIARELHDGLGVLLSATKMQFTSLKDVTPENQPLIEKATQLLEQATGDVRKISHNMMPGLLTKLGFFEAVEELFDNINESEKIKATCKITGEKVRMPENNEIMLYRIIQEMVNNTLKHARANAVDLNIKTFPGNIHINYSDDGIGFDVQNTLKDENASFGMRNMQSRVAFLDGEMDIQSWPGEGVRYTMHFPF